MDRYRYDTDPDPTFHFVFNAFPDSDQPQVLHMLENLKKKKIIYLQGSEGCQLTLLYLYRQRHHGIIVTILTV